MVTDLTVLKENYNLYPGCHCIDRNGSILYVGYLDGKLYTFRDKLMLKDIRDLSDSDRIKLARLL